jgi:hypothetical protein
MNGSMHLHEPDLTSRWMPSRVMRSWAFAALVTAAASAAWLLAVDPVSVLRRSARDPGAVADASGRVEVLLSLLGLAAVGATTLVLLVFLVARRRG